MVTQAFVVALNVVNAMEKHPLLLLLHLTLFLQCHFRCLVFQQFLDFKL